MKEDLRGKVAIVTGGARGIGKAIVNAFAEEGAKVAIFDLDPEDSDLIGELRKTMCEFDKKCLYKKTDVTNVNEVRRAVKETINVFGKVDILVNNAGGGSASYSFRGLGTKGLGLGD